MKPVYTREDLQGVASVTDEVTSRRCFHLLPVVEIIHNQEAGSSRKGPLTVPGSCDLPVGWGTMP
jgi:hypothetical protein